MWENMGITHLEAALQLIFFSYMGLPAMILGI
jgi:hypothetical protein